jgi:mannose-6-phosphate isomerase-like protein (cupin superfamily)
VVAQDWPDELDALVASTAHHWLLLENDSARVLETVIPPGETTEVHTHRWPNVQFVVSGSHLIKRDPDGAVLSESGVEDAETLWSGPIPPHTVENVGPGELRVIVVELKR